MRLKALARGFAPLAERLKALARGLALLEARLKALAEGFGLLVEFIGLTVLRFLCGYGERPLRTLWWFSGLVIVFGLGYFLFGELQPHNFSNCLYYSLVSSTALGYGGWAPEPQGWAQAMGAVQSAFGIFLMALFVATFTRWVTR